MQLIYQCFLRNTWKNKRIQPPGWHKREKKEAKKQEEKKIKKKN